jgi:predicted Zn-dependent protease
MRTKPSLELLLLTIITYISTSAISLGAEKKNGDIEAIGARNINAGQMNFYSVEREISLGRELAEELETSIRILNDPEITVYINRLGQNLVRSSDAKVPFAIKVVDSEEINAMALPGGFLYVNTGLIRAASEEAELAGVMAHEIAHIAARHSTEQVSKGRFFNFASLPLIFLGGPAGYTIRQAAGLMLPLQMLHFNRRAEREADFLGLQYLYKAGYDPTALVSFFEKVKSQEKRKSGFLTKTFSTHPVTEDRIRKSQEQIEQSLPPRDEYALSSSDFEHIKARLEVLENAQKRADEAAEDPSHPRLQRRTTNPSDDDIEPSSEAESTDLQLTKK